MSRTPRLPRIVFALLTLAALACTTVTTLPERLFRQAGPTSRPAPATTAPGTTPQPGTAATPRTTDGGPTVGTPREARVAQAEGAPFMEALAEEQYSYEELNTVGARLKYTLKVDDRAARLLWGVNWCATTRAILRENLAKMEYEFRINGEPVNIAAFDMADGRSSDGLECRYLTAVVYDWPSGTTTLETQLTFTEAVNDGQADYPAGDQIFTYEVTAP